MDTDAVFFLPFAVAALLFVLLLEQLSYIRKKGPLPGPPLVVPFLGSAARIFRDAPAFWDSQAALAESSGHGMSANYVLGRFIVFVADNALSHAVFSGVGPDAVHPVVNIFDKKIFSDRNIFYLFGQQHKDLRRRMVRNLKPSALAVYSAVQRRAIARHLRTWPEAAPVELWHPLKEMILEISLEVFAGPYLSADIRRQFGEQYKLFEVVVHAVPVDLPGFAFHRGLRAKAKLTESFTAVVRESRSRMSAGAEPGCLIDFWMQQVVSEHDETRDEQTGEDVLSLFFAAQDTNASSLCWSVALLAANQEVVERVRSEVSVVSPEKLPGLRYTQAVAKEVLRVRPPAEIVPHIAGEPFRVSGGYTVPKGAMVFPSVYESTVRGFPDGGRFDPDRFMEPRNEDRLRSGHFLVFGAGAHRCAGQRYALNLLVLFIAMFVSEFDFERRRSEGCDGRVYSPLSAPKDGCAVFLRRRRRGTETPELC